MSDKLQFVVTGSFFAKRDKLKFVGQRTRTREYFIRRDRGHAAMVDRAVAQHARRAVGRMPHNLGRP